MGEEDALPDILRATGERIIHRCMTASQRMSRKSRLENRRTYNIFWLSDSLILSFTMRDQAKGTERE